MFPTMMKLIRVGLVFAAFICLLQPQEVDGCGLVKLYQESRSWYSNSVAYVTQNGPDERVDATSNNPWGEQYTWFWIRRPGLGCYYLSGSCGGDRCVSLESYNLPNHYLANQEWGGVTSPIMLRPFQDTVNFHTDATFCMRNIYGEYWLSNPRYDIYITNVDGKLSTVRSGDISWFDRKTKYWKKEHLPCPTPAPTSMSPTTAPTPCSLVQFLSHDRTKTFGVRNWNGDITHQNVNDGFHKDNWFWVRQCHHDKGNCGGDRCVSLESYMFPGFWLKTNTHDPFKIVGERFHDRDAWHIPASWCLKKAKNGDGVTFESVNYPNHYVSTRTGGNFMTLRWIGGGNTAEHNAASFHKVHKPCPITNTCVTFLSADKQLGLNHYAYQFAAWKDYDRVNGKFFIRRCMHDLKNCGESECVTLESINWRGQYLRHIGFNIRLDPGEDRDLYHKDASFCLNKLDGQGLPAQNIGEYVELESVNYQHWFLESDASGHDPNRDPVELRDSNNNNYNRGKSKEMARAWIMVVNHDCGNPHRRLQTDIRFEDWEMEFDDNNAQNDEGTIRAGSTTDGKLRGQPSGNGTVLAANFE